MLESFSIAVEIVGTLVSAIYIGVSNPGLIPSAVLLAITAVLLLVLLFFSIVRASPVADEERETVLLVNPPSSAPSNSKMKVQSAVSSHGPSPAMFSNTKPLEESGQQILSQKDQQVASVEELQASSKEFHGPLPKEEEIRWTSASGSKQPSEQNSRQPSLPSQAAPDETFIMPPQRSTTSPMIQEALNSLACERRESSPAAPQQQQVPSAALTLEEQRDVEIYPLADISPPESTNASKKRSHSRTLGISVPEKSPRTPSVTTIVQFNPLGAPASQPTDVVSLSSDEDCDVDIEEEWKNHTTNWSDELIEAMPRNRVLICVHCCIGAALTAVGVFTTVKTRKAEFIGAIALSALHLLPICSVNSQMWKLSGTSLLYFGLWLLLIAATCGALIPILDPTPDSPTVNNSQEVSVAGLFVLVTSITMVVLHHLCWFVSLQERTGRLFPALTDTDVDAAVSALKSAFEGRPRRGLQLVDGIHQPLVRAVLNTVMKKFRIQKQPRSPPRSPPGGKLPTAERLSPGLPSFVTHGVTPLNSIAFARFRASCSKAEDDIDFLSSIATDDDDDRPNSVVAKPLGESKDGSLCSLSDSGQSATFLVSTTVIRKLAILCVSCEELLCQEDGIVPLFHPTPPASPLKRGSVAASGYSRPFALLHNAVLSAIRGSGGAILQSGAGSRIFVFWGLDGPLADGPFFAAQCGITIVSNLATAGLTPRAACLMGKGAVLRDRSQSCFRVVGPDVTLCGVLINLAMELEVDCLVSNLIAKACEFSHLTRPVGFVAGRTIRNVMKTHEVAIASVPGTESCNQNPAACTEGTVAQPSPVFELIRSNGNFVVEEWMYAVERQQQNAASLHLELYNEAFNHFALGAFRAAEKKLRRFLEQQERPDRPGLNLLRRTVNCAQASETAGTVEPVIPSQSDRLWTDSHIMAPVHCNTADGWKAVSSDASFDSQKT